MAPTLGRRRAVRRTAAALPRASAVPTGPTEFPTTPVFPSARIVRIAHLGQARELRQTMEGHALTAPPIVLPILGAIAPTTRLSGTRLLTIAAIHHHLEQTQRLAARTPRPLAPIQLPIGAILRRAVRIPRLSLAILRRAVHIPRLSAATLRRAVRIPRLSVATLHLAVLTLRPAVPTRLLAAVPVAAEEVVVAPEAGVAAGHRTAGVAAGPIDKYFNPFFPRPASLQIGGPFSLFTFRRQSQTLIHNSVASHVFNQ